MKTTLTVASACLIAIACADARPGGNRQRGPRDGGGDAAGGHRPPPPAALFMRFDTDRNGVLDPDEIAQAPAIMEQLDANHDGELSPDELHQAPPGDEADGPQPPRQGRPPGPPPIIAVLDADRDGVISAAELEAAPEALAQLDHNEDGELTRDEYAPQGPPPPDDGAAE